MQIDKCILALMTALLLVIPSFAADESGGQIILKESANCSRNLRPFKVKDKWEVRWDSSKDITVWLNDEKGQPLERLASSKAGSGSTFHPTGGSYFLKIISSGDWTITVIQLP